MTTKYRPISVLDTAAQPADTNASSQATSASSETNIPSLGTAAALTAAAALAACGGDGIQTAKEKAAREHAMYEPPILPLPAEGDDAPIVRFLLRAQFSASKQDVLDIRSNGYSSWLKNRFNQLDQNYQTAWSWLLTNEQGEDQDYNINENKSSDKPTDRLGWYLLFAGKNPVLQRMALALSEIFVVSVNGVDKNWPSFAMARYWDVLINCIQTDTFFGLAKKLTRNLAMGKYLNIVDNKKADGTHIPDEKLCA